MTQNRNKGNYATRICTQCDEWYKPENKSQRHCDKCKSKNQESPFKREKTERSEELNEFYRANGFIQ